MESNIKGISVRAWLALITVGSGLAFLYGMAFFALAFLTGDFAAQIALAIVMAVIAFVNLALGFYLGQKNSGMAENATNITTAEDVTVNRAPVVTKEPTG